MLGLDNQSLLFPKLVYVRDGELVRKAFPKYACGPDADGNPSKQSKAKIPEERTKVRIYRLDWTKVESIKAQKHEERFKSIYGTDTMPYPGPLPNLPKSYALMMASLELAIPDKYMKAIHHCAMSAMKEWEHPYPFDTSIREGCYEPAAAFVKVAFNLISDCIYDPDKRYFDRNWDTRAVFLQTALVRFWIHQTGDWVAFNNAGLSYAYEGEMRNKFYAFSREVLARAYGAAEQPCQLERMTADMGEFYTYIRGERVIPAVPAGKLEVVKPPKRVKTKK